MHHQKFDHLFSSKTKLVLKMSRFFFKKLKIIMAVKFFFYSKLVFASFQNFKVLGVWPHLKFENFNLLSNPKNWIFDLIKKIQQVTRKSKLAKLCTVFFPRFPIYYISDSSVRSICFEALLLPSAIFWQGCENVSRN